MYCTKEIEKLNRELADLETERERLVNKLIRAFFKTYPAIDKLHFQEESEYDDNGGYYSYINDVEITYKNTDRQELIKMAKSIFTRERLEEVDITEVVDTERICSKLGLEEFPDNIYRSRHRDDILFELLDTSGWRFFYREDWANLWPELQSVFIDHSEGRGNTYWAEQYVETTNQVSS